MDVFRAAVALIVRSMVLSAQAAGQQRLLLLKRAIAADEEVGELARLRDENRRLNSELRMLKDRFGEAPARRRYTPMQRLQILWHMEYHGIPRNRVTVRMSDGNETPLTAPRACLHGSDFLRLGTIRHLRVLLSPPSQAGFTGG